LGFNSTSLDVDVVVGVVTIPYININVGASDKQLVLIAPTPPKHQSSQRQSGRGDGIQSINTIRPSILCSFYLSQLLISSA
jgi:hypothetical protein